MNRLRFAPARAHHCRAVIEQLRERDVAELRALYGPDTNLLGLAEFALAASSFAEACFYEAELLAIYGLVPMTVLGHTSQVWLMVTRAVDRHPRAFLRASRLVLANLHRLSGALTNHVDVADEAVARWLDWLGATYVAQPWRDGRHVFAQFMLRAPTVRRALEATKGATCLPQ